MPPPCARRNPTRASLGIASLSISSLLLFSSVPKFESPVILPPGRARLATRPAPTGSPEFAITMGTVVVAFFAANADGSPVITIKSTLRRSKSAVSSGNRSRFCPENRYSMMRFFPSIQPSLLSSCRNASKRTAIPEAVLCIQKTDAGDFPCLLRVCPRPHTMSTTTIAESPTANLDFGFSIADCRNKDRKLASKKLLSCAFSANPKSKIENPKSLDHLIRPLEHAVRNCQTNLFCRLQVDDEFKLRRLLHRQISRFGAFQDLVHVNGRAPKRSS